MVSYSLICLCFSNNNNNSNLSFLFYPVSFLSHYHSFHLCHMSIPMNASRHLQKPSHPLFPLSQVANTSPGCPCGSTFSWGISCVELARPRCNLWESHTSMITLWRKMQPSTSVHLNLCFALQRDGH